MNLAEAEKLIEESFTQIDRVYGSTVFDEWAIIALERTTTSFLFYRGPRKEVFLKNFGADLQLLTPQLTEDYNHLGDLHFARHGSGTLFDAYLTVGLDVFVICNNTVSSLETITRTPRWLAVRAALVELADKFRHNPVIV